MKKPKDNTRRTLVCVTQPTCLCSSDTSGFDCDCPKPPGAKQCPACGASIVTVAAYERMHARKGTA